MRRDRANDRGIRGVPPRGIFQPKTRQDLSGLAPVLRLCGRCHSLSFLRFYDVLGLRHPSRISSGLVPIFSVYVYSAPISKLLRAPDPIRSILRVPSGVPRRRSQWGAWVVYKILREKLKYARITDKRLPRKFRCSYYIIESANGHELPAFVRRRMRRRSEAAQQYTGCPTVVPTLVRW